MTTSITLHRRNRAMLALLLPGLSLQLAAQWLPEAAWLGWSSITLCLGALLCGLSSYRQDPIRGLAMTPCADRQSGLDPQLITELTEEVAQVGHWHVDLVQERLYWSPEVYRIHGYPPGGVELRVAEAINFYHPDDRAEVDAMVNKAITSRSQFSFVKRLVRKDGETVWVESHGRCLSGDDGKVHSIFGVFRDITEQRQKLQELEESQQRLLFATDGGGDGVWEWRPFEKRMYVSPAGVRMLGYEPEEFSGTEQAWAALLHPEDLKKALATFSSVVQNSTAGNHIEVEYRLRCQDGGYRWVRARGLVVERDAQGDAQRVFGTHNDIQDHRDALARARRAGRELHLINGELKQFAYAASHDLQEPLRTLSSYAKLVDRRYADKLDDEGREFLGFITEAAARMQKLIEDLLAFSKAGSAEMKIEPQDVGELVAEVREQIAAKIRDTGASVTVSASGHVEADRAQLLRLLQNLISNAINYRHPDRPPAIDVQVVSRFNDCELRVSDNGVGIEPEQQERVFALFQRLHTEDQVPGTGMGLAICRRIAQRHGGEISVTSNPGEGSCFLVRLNRPAAAIGQHAA